MLERVTAVGFKDDYYQHFRYELMKIADNRFSPNSKEAFDLAKRLTKYNTFEKRDGGIVSAAYHQGKLLEGVELERALL